MASRLLPSLALAGFVSAAFLAVVGAPAAHADEATDRARSHYETGLELFYARQHAQALIEFQRAHEIKPRPATLFMMGQCEYLLGSIRQARDHYEAYLKESPTGEFVEVAKDRIESINRRPATLVINTVPDQVDVRITPAATLIGAGATTPPPDSPPASGTAVPPTIISGQAPNNFALPRGRWAVTVAKPNYQSQQVTVEVEVAETKPLFFKLEPIPARLEIETVPAGATLYVNGNRVQNPYRQDVAPGHFEIFGEATDYRDRRDNFVLGPSERRLLVGPNNRFALEYVQRSGRPELVFTSAVLGGLVIAGAVGAAVTAAEEVGGAGSNNVSSVSFTLGGALAGTVGGFIIGNRFVPSYIPDNRALFVIGGMWIGAAEGALTGMTIRQGMVGTYHDVQNRVAEPYRQPAKLSSELRSAFIGSLPGLAVGVTTGALLSNKAPTYGRVSLIQSAALGGAVVGGLGAVALRWNPFGWSQVTRDAPGVDHYHLESVAQYSTLDLSLPALIGLNVGLAGGLLGAYLPDQSQYGPSWQRIVLIDLAAGAGALAGGIGACVADNSGCLTSVPAPAARARTAWIALGGGAAGLLAGILLTRNIDRNLPTDAASPSTPPASLSLLPIPAANGGTVPGLGAFGFF